MTSEASIKLYERSESILAFAFRFHKQGLTENCPRIERKRDSIEYEPWRVPRAVLTIPLLLWAFNNKKAFKCF